LSVSPMYSHLFALEIPNTPKRRAHIGYRLSS
jgi:hypothetical protein